MISKPFKINSTNNELKQVSFEKTTPTDVSQSIDRSSEQKRKDPLIARKKETRRDAPKPIVDAGDMFDIHSYDYLEEEFGTITRTQPYAKHNKPHDADDEEIVEESNKNNENFNFVEACEALRTQIQASKQQETDDAISEHESCDKNAVNISDIRDMKEKNFEIADGSIELHSDDSPNVSSIDGTADEFSNRSTIGSSHNPSEFADLENVISALNINEQEQVEEERASNDVNDIYNNDIYLASGSQENFVVIWNANEGKIVDKIQFKPQQNRLAIPSMINFFFF